MRLTGVFGRHDPHRSPQLAVKKAISDRAQTVTRDAAGNVAVGSRAVSLRLPR
jgi:hypothetical protein